VSIVARARQAGLGGRPVPAAQVRLVDDYDREVPVGTPGEITVRGPLVFQGYYAQPDVTAYTLRNGWHHTGDVGRFDADGYLYYVKRKPEKELIKPGGENVYPAEVETVIMQMAGVQRVCVYGIPDAAGARRSRRWWRCRRRRSHRPGGHGLRGLEDRPLQAPARGGVHRRAPAHRRGRGGPGRGQGQWGEGAS
jgi:acyl-CoA synthetase (AMP-forming)/AMP-acid ligase II